MRSAGTEGHVGALVGIERRALPSAKAGRRGCGAQRAHCEEYGVCWECVIFLATWGQSGGGNLEQEHGAYV